MADNKYITVAYKLYVKEEGDEAEELVEQCEAAHPFQFLSGFGMVIPAFEGGVANVEAGGQFDFVIPCADAYGEFEEELMFDVPRQIFEINGKLDTQHIFEGNVVPMQGEDGSRFNATIIEIKDKEVTIDLNHPRAGQDLHFVGSVVTNRPATAEELAQMAEALSGEGGCCGGGCGHCGGGCGDGGNCGGGNCGGGCGNCGN